MGMRHTIADRETLRTAKGVGLLAMAIATLTGCGSVATPVTLNAYPVMATGLAFALVPSDWQAPATPTAPEAPVTAGAVVGAIGSATIQDPIVKVMGRAILDNTAARMANVREGQVTGTPIYIIDARNNRTLGKAVTYYDGSFSAEVAVNYANMPIIVTLDLIDQDDPSERAALSASLVLHPGDSERRVAVTPGSTALTMFLSALATTTATSQSEILQAAPGPLQGEPKLGALIAGINDDERASFTRMAESADELRGAGSVAAFRAGLANFLGQMSIKTKD